MKLKIKDTEYNFTKDSNGDIRVDNRIIKASSLIGISPIMCISCKKYVYYMPHKNNKIYEIKYKYAPNNLFLCKKCFDGIYLLTTLIGN